MSARTEIAREGRPGLDLPRLAIEDLFKVGEGFPAEDRLALETYLSRFANPKRGDRHVCIACDAEMNGLMAALGVGAAYEWGLAHGEARCSACGWPARGVHYIKREDGTEICTLRNVFLPYHPSEVTANPQQPGPESGRRA